MRYKPRGVAQAVQVAHQHGRAVLRGEPRQLVGAQPLSVENPVREPPQERDVGALTLTLARQGIGILSLTPELATLEDLFFRLTEGDGEPDLEDSQGERPPRSGEADAGVLGYEMIQLVKSVRPFLATPARHAGAGTDGRAGRV